MSKEIACDESWINELEEDMFRCFTIAPLSNRVVEIIRSRNPAFVANMINQEENKKSDDFKHEPDFQLGNEEIFTVTDDLNYLNITPQYSRKGISYKMSQKNSKIETEATLFRPSRSLAVMQTSGERHRVSSDGQHIDNQFLLRSATTNVMESTHSSNKLGVSDVDALNRQIEQLRKENEQLHEAIDALAHQGQTRRTKSETRSQSMDSETNNDLIESTNPPESFREDLGDPETASHMIYDKTVVIRSRVLGVILEADFFGNSAIVSRFQATDGNSSPAMRAGVVIDDALVAVNGVDVSSMSFRDIMHFIRGCSLPWTLVFRPSDAHYQIQALRKLRAERFKEHAKQELDEGDVQESKENKRSSALLSIAQIKRFSLFQH